MGASLQRNYVVNTTSDSLQPGPGLLSLREAILLANIDQLPSTITFDPTAFATHETITETNLLHLVSSASAGTGAYYYQVVAVTAYGDVASAEAGAATDTGTLTWNPVSGADSYLIYRRASGSGYGLLATVAGQTLAYTDTGGSTSGNTGLAFAWLELRDTTSLDTITGPAAGVTIDGGGLGPVFQIDAGGLPHPFPD